MADFSPEIMYIFIYIHIKDYWLFKTVIKMYGGIMPYVEVTYIIIKTQILGEGLSTIKLFVNFLA